MQPRSCYVRSHARTRRRTRHSTPHELTPPTGYKADKACCARAGLGWWCRTNRSAHPASWQWLPMANRPPRVHVPCYNPSMTCVTLAGDLTDRINAAAACAGVVVAFAAIVWGRRDASPQRRVSYSFEKTRLLTSSVDDLVVTRGSERLTHPHTVTLKLIIPGNAS